jgi:hypothetical protein
MAGDSIDVTARTYHTVDGVPHDAGEVYAVADRAMAENLYGIGFVGVVGWTEDVAPPPAPTLSSLNPATAVAGSASVTVQVIGAGFAPSDVASVAGAPVATVVVSATELSIPVDAAAMVAAGDVPVSVATAGGLQSNVLTFAVTAAY